MLAAADPSQSAPTGRVGCNARTHRRVARNTIPAVSAAEKTCKTAIAVLDTALIQFARRTGAAAGPGT